MRLLLAFLVLASSIVHVHAQLPAALKPQADKFEADRAALAVSAENRLKPARDRYLAALDTAQKAATAGGRPAESVGIAAEMREIGAGTPAAEFPPDLPRSLLPQRRDYMAVFTTVQKIAPKSLRDIASKYLQAIAVVEPAVRKSADATAIAAIAAEKERVKSLFDAAGGTQKHQNIVANSDFSEGEVGSFPSKWRAEAEIAVSDATIVADGEARFLRFRRLQPLRRANLMPEKEVTIPANARGVTFSVRLRVKDLVPGKTYNQYPGVHVTGRDARGEERGGDWAMVKQDTNWKRFIVRFPLAPEAKTLRIAIGPFGAAALLDVDDVEVEFK